MCKGVVAVHDSIGRRAGQVCGSVWQCVAVCTHLAEVVQRVRHADCHHVVDVEGHVGVDDKRRRGTRLRVDDERRGGDVMI